MEVPTYPICSAYNPKQSTFFTLIINAIFDDLNCFIIFIIGLY